MGLKATTLPRRPENTGPAFFAYFLVYGGDRKLGLISSEKRGENVDQMLRPQTLDEFVGQQAVPVLLMEFVS